MSSKWYWCNAHQASSQDSVSGGPAHDKILYEGEGGEEIPAKRKISGGSRAPWASPLAMCLTHTEKTNALYGKVVEQLM